jgi:hypothetical protein
MIIRSTSALAAWVAVALLSAGAEGRLEETRTPRIPDLERYTTSESWRISAGKLRVLPLNEVGTSVVVEIEPAAGAS